MASAEAKVWLNSNGFGKATGISMALKIAFKMISRCECAETRLRIYQNKQSSDELYNMAKTLFINRKDTVDYRNLRSWYLALKEDISEGKYDFQLKSIFDAVEGKVEPSTKFINSVAAE